MRVVLYIQFAKSQDFLSKNRKSQTLPFFTTYLLKIRQKLKILHQFQNQYLIQNYQKLVLSKALKNKSSRYVKTEIRQATISFARFSILFLIILLKRLYMQPGKDNYLEVTYQTQKGLIFKWNFKDLFQHSIFFHHLFVIRETNKDLLNQILSNYYSKMKFGDLFSFIYYSESKKTVKKSPWVEKTQLQTFDFKKLINRISSLQISTEIKSCLHQKVLEQTLEQSQNYVVNFILEKDAKETKEQLTRLIQISRNQGSCSYICTFFGYFKINQVSFTNGINFLNLEQIHNVIPFYNLHLNNAAIKNAKITLECKNIQLISHRSNFWHNVDFNKLEKMFYGPSISYQFDEIHFYQSDFLKSRQVQILITLNITLFSRQQINSSKKIKLRMRQEKIYEKSLCLDRSENYLCDQGIWLSSYPYSSLSIVRMIRQSSY